MTKKNNNRQIEYFRLSFKILIKKREKIKEEKFLPEIFHENLQITQRMSPV